MDELKFEEHLRWAEGVRSLPYKDSVGVLTIGVGRNLERGLSDDEIGYLLSNDVRDVLRDARTLSYWPQLNEARQLVVADLVFNLGLARWLKFAKANAALERDDYAAAADELVDSTWYRQVGRRAVKLVAAMRSGEWA
jgi:lysozyme